MIHHMNRRLFILAAALLTASFNINAAEKVNTETAKPTATANQKIVVGGGCYWCVEAVFQRLEGVKAIKSGFSGGHVKNPTYEQVCNEKTGHAEVVQIEFDPAVLTLDKLLDVFFVSHDPTTLNRQGRDVGESYRSVIYYANDDQKKAAEAAKVRAKSEWKDPIVTEISPFKEFYAAEDYHQNYFNLNKDKNPYCSIIIAPKLNKLLKMGVIKEKQ
jgi:peptide-methionine (S)-S-oxide reductase